MDSPNDRANERFTHKKIEIGIKDPGGYEHFVELEVCWEEIHKALPARINYDTNDCPSEAAEYELWGVEVL